MASAREQWPDDRPAAVARRFLIVDDDRLVRELFSEALSTLGRVDVAADGIEALARLRQERYDLILSDVDMPRMDGCGLFEAAVADRPELAGAFVFVTADGGAVGRLRLPQDGRPPVLRKPVRVDELTGYVRRKLGATNKRAEVP